MVVSGKDPIHQLVGQKELWIAVAVYDEHRAHVRRDMTIGKRDRPSGRNPFAAFVALITE